MVGTIVRLKRDCLGNPKGTLGVVFYDYGDGFQAIFENGQYDGFSTDEVEDAFDHQTEADYFLEKVRIERSLIGYYFKNVMATQRDFRAGVFDCIKREI